MFKRKYVLIMKQVIILTIALFTSISMNGQSFTDSLFFKTLSVKIQKMIELDLMAGESFWLHRNDMYGVYPQHAADKQVKHTALNYGDLLDFKIIPLELPVLPDTSYLYYTVVVEETTKNMSMLKNTGVTTNEFLREGNRFIVIVHNVDPLRFTLLKPTKIYDSPYYPMVDIYDAYKKQGFNRDNVFSYLYFEFYSKGLAKLTFEKEDSNYFYFMAEFHDGSIKQLRFDKIVQDYFNRIKQTTIKKP